MLQNYEVDQQIRSASSSSFHFVLKSDISDVPRKSLKPEEMKTMKELFTSSNILTIQSKTTLQFSTSAKSKLFLITQTSDKLVILTTSSWIKVMGWSLELFVTLQVQGLAFKNGDILP